MPYYFKFYDRQEDDDPKFSCRLQAERCSGRTKAGNQCSRSSVIGTPWCWTHLLAVKHLRIKDSTVAGAGKGLFALDKSRPTGEILFRPGQDIIEYAGELIAKVERDGEEAVAHRCRRVRQQRALLGARRDRIEQRQAQIVVTAGGTPAVLEPSLIGEGGGLGVAGQANGGGQQAENISLKPLGRGPRIK